MKGGWLAGVGRDGSVKWGLWGEGQQGGLGLGRAQRKQVPPSDASAFCSDILMYHFQENICEKIG